jgi:hypothetical protein
MGNRESVDREASGDDYQVVTELESYAGVYLESEPGYPVWHDGTVICPVERGDWEGSLAWTGEGPHFYEMTVRGAPFPVVLRQGKIPLPSPSSAWRHHSGRLYHVILVANEHTTHPDRYPVMIVYRGAVNGFIWSKSLARFLATMTEVLHAPGVERPSDDTPVPY